MSIAELAARQIAKAQDERERNRRDFPYLASVIDMLRDPALLKDGLPPLNPRVIWAEENGKTIGAVPHGTQNGKV